MRLLRRRSLISRRVAVGKFDKNEFTARVREIHDQSRYSYRVELMRQWVQKTLPN
jgi:hypothetical protein